MTVVERYVGRLEKTAELRAKLPSERVDALLSYDELGFDELVGLNRVANRMAQFSSLLDPADARIGRGLRLLGRSGAALFGGVDKGTTSEMQIREVGAPHRIGVLDNGPDVRFGTWLTAHHAARCMRDHEAADMLSAIDVDVLQYGDRDYLARYMEALEAVHHRRPDAGERLLCALEAADPRHVPADDTGFVLDQVTPMIALALRAIQGDPRAFNSALVTALERHRKRSKSVRALGDYLLALGPLSLACFAVDEGLPVEVSSDYMPVPILNLNR